MASSRRATTSNPSPSPTAKLNPSPNPNPNEARNDVFGGAALAALVRARAARGAPLVVLSLHKHCARDGRSQPFESFRAAQLLSVGALVISQASHPADEEAYRGLVTFVPLEHLAAEIAAALARPDSAEHAARRAALFRERFQPQAILARAAGPYSRPPALPGPSGASGEGRTVPPLGPLGSTPSRPGPLPDTRALPPAPAHEPRAAACRPGTACCKRHPRVKTCTAS